MADMLNIRGGPDGANNGWVDPAHIGAVFFLAGPDVELEIPEGNFTVYLRLRDGSTVRDLTTSKRDNALSRANTVKAAIEEATSTVILSEFLSSGD